METGNPTISLNQSELPSLYKEGEYQTLTPKVIANDPAKCDHRFVIMEGGSRELVCQLCPYGGYFRLGVDLDELRDGIPYFKGERVYFKRVGRSPLG